jgi:propanediol dehydratase small subunit
MFISRSGDGIWGGAIFRLAELSTDDVDRVVRLLVSTGKPKIDTMNLGLVVLLIAGLIFLAAGEIVTQLKLRRFSRRGCMGSEWRRAFPEASKQDIRTFLNLFVQTFGISRKHSLHFSPDDRIVDVYNAVEPAYFSMGVDFAELENFADEIQKECGVDLSQNWREDISLGDVFACTRRDAA